MTLEKRTFPRDSSVPNVPSSLTDARKKREGKQIITQSIKLIIDETGYILDFDEAKGLPKTRTEAF